MKDSTLGLVVSVLWIAWLLIWLIASRNVKETRWREPFSSEWRHRAPLIIAVLLIGWPPLAPASLRTRFVPGGPATGLVGLAIVVAGFAFAIWARWYLGSNWSAMVTVKADHTLVRGGPYRLVRHPIYTGILLALLGTALVIGEWRGIVAVGFAFVSFLIKSRIEEARMRETFPEYDAYARETKALVPFIY